VEPAAEATHAWSCSADRLAPGQTAKFRLFRRGKPVEAFIINTGLCVEGPCPGASLERLPVEADGPTLVVRCPS